MHGESEGFVRSGPISVGCFREPATARMEWLFGRRMTPEEQLKKNQRALNKVARVVVRLLPPRGSK